MVLPMSICVKQTAASLQISLGHPPWASMAKPLLRNCIPLSELRADALSFRMWLALLILDLPGVRDPDVLERSYTSAHYWDVSIACFRQTRWRKPCDQNEGIDKGYVVEQYHLQHRDAPQSSHLVKEKTEQDKKKPIGNLLGATTTACWVRASSSTTKVL